MVMAMASWTRLLWCIVAWVMWLWCSLVHIVPYLTPTHSGESSNRYSHFLVPKQQLESGVNVKVKTETAATSQTSGWKRSRTNEDWNRFLDGANNSTPNILILITDQMRKPRRRRQPKHRRGGQDDWIADQLHVTQRLMKHGLTFENAMVAASPCSPSRAALWTGTYPQVNGVLDVVTTMTPPWKQLRPRNQEGGFATLGNLFQDANYETVYKGKWHLHNPLFPNADSLKDFGFTKWNPPDNPYYLSEAKNYDRRCAISDNTYESAVDYLKDWSNRLAQSENKEDDSNSGGGESPKPFFTVVSLVNPHDITYFLGKWEDILPGGYNSTEVEQMTGSLRAPENANEFIRPPNHLGRYNKPNVQHYYQPPWTREQRDQYAQFYAYLNHYIEKPGGDLDAVVNALSKEALDRTLIVRFSDHGEMGMSHGLLEKMSVAYEEVLNVPLVVSNPIAFPNKNNNNNESVSQSKSSSSQRLVSLVDLMPTLLTLAGLRVPSSAVGVDFSYTIVEQEDDNDMFVADGDEKDKLHDKKNKKDPSNQNAVIFTNDYPSRNTSMYLPDLIRCIRTGHDYKGAPNHKYAVYFKPGSTYFQFELYDLNTDPNENTNLLANDNDGNVLPRNASAHSQFLIWNLLHTDLTARLKKISALPAEPSWPHTLPSASSEASLYI